eukprot:CAMPEP_0174899072 /NCGR_PEP_ID=MMETSP0167-20121228/25253_1 /TAXON_ID=38298 /ORGANISM="Rhodella maculata, Strain CCMP736" /LENGTH=125 /DNA_ID=CAMNT_0016139921 /DNA_START=18 /DNA_END=391 /DNA_ORIENTATION=-
MGSVWFLREGGRSYGLGFGRELRGLAGADVVLPFETDGRRRAEAGRRGLSGINGHIFLRELRFLQKHDAFIAGGVSTSSYRIIVRPAHDQKKSRGAWRTCARGSGFEAPDLRSAMRETRGADPSG